MSEKRWIETSGKYWMLKYASCKIAGDIGGMAYFVGSALHSETRPRDTDVRIVLHDVDFEARYGLSVKDWQRQAHTLQWSVERWEWHHEVERYQVMIADACGERTVDLGIIPEWMWKAIYEKAPHETWGNTNYIANGYTSSKNGEPA